MQLELRSLKADQLLALHLEPLPPEGRLVDRLEEALRRGCKAIGAPLPLWMTQNTEEFARFRQTRFFADQFLEATPFDRLHIRLLEDTHEGR